MKGIVNKRTPQYCNPLALLLSNSHSNRRVPTLAKKSLTLKSKKTLNPLMRIKKVTNEAP
jgi:hypothetical protein